jgi:hypothetical protein
MLNDEWFVHTISISLYFYKPLILVTFSDFVKGQINYILQLSRFPL